MIIKNLYFHVLKQFYILLFTLFSKIIRLSYKFKFTPSLLEGIFINSFFSNTICGIYALNYDNFVEFLKFRSLKLIP